MHDVQPHPANCALPSTPYSIAQSCGSSVGQSSRPHCCGTHVHELVLPWNVPHGGRGVGLAAVVGAGVGLAVVVGAGVGSAVVVGAGVGLAVVGGGVEAEHALVTSRLVHAHGHATLLEHRTVGEMGWPVVARTQ